MKFNIESYENPLFPDRTYYKCTIDGITYHNADYKAMFTWAMDRIAHAEYYALCKKLEDKGMVSFNNN